MWIYQSVRDCIKMPTFSSLFVCAVKQFVFDCVPRHGGGVWWRDRDKEELYSDIRLTKRAPKYQVNSVSVSKCPTFPQTGKSINRQWRGSRDERERQREVSVCESESQGRERENEKRKTKLNEAERLHSCWSKRNMVMERSMWRE